LSFGRLVVWSFRKKATDDKIREAQASPHDAARRPNASLYEAEGEPAFS